ncbi:hypothetical protein BH23THE1_BH23THE1_31140 [soil metagenome]
MQETGSNPIPSIVFTGIDIEFLNEKIENSLVNAPYHH